MRWTRVLLEGALIVGSILLAFWVQASWDSTYALTGLGTRGSAPERFMMSDAEYRTFIARPQVYATVERALATHSNLEILLRWMDATLAEALVAVSEQG